jgi:hypothetical protein
MSLRADLERALEKFRKANNDLSASLNTLEEIMDEHLNGPKPLPPHIERKLTSALDDALLKK